MTGRSGAGIFQDLKRNVLIGVPDERVSAGRILTTFFTLRFQSVFLLRVAQSVGRWVPPLASVIKQFNQLVTGADLAWEAGVGSGLVLFHPVGVVVGPYVRIGRDCVIQQGVTIGGDGVSHIGPSPSPTLGDSVVVGAGARVIGDVTVLDDCIVGANAVVTRSSTSACSVAVGIPAVWRERSRAKGRT